MDTFDHSGAAQLAATANEPGWLNPLRSAARDHWLRSTLPHAKTESWRHTSIAALSQADYLRFGHDAGLDASAAHEAEQELAALSERVALEGLSGPRLVFVNGEYHAALSTAPANAAHAGLTRFRDADDHQQMLIKQHLGQVAAPDHVFATLNSSWLDDGVLYHLNQPDQATEPLHIVHLTRPLEHAFTARQRLLVVVEPHCQGTVIEHFDSNAGQQNCFVNGVSEFVVNEGAQLTHYRLHLEEEHSIHIGGAYAHLQRDARLDSFCLALGGQLKRLDLRVAHQGAGSECNINGVYLSKGKQHVDLHATIEHEAAHGTTAEVFRGIIDDQARAVFNGRIHIHPQAQKTLAELSNRNLLLSNQAELYTKPELEIYADDVRCAHGATVAQIDEQALYYLQSRGIDRKEAQVMLSFGFINELLDQLPHEPVRQRLRPVLSNWFGKDSRLTRHIL